MAITIPPSLMGAAPAASPLAGNDNTGAPAASGQSGGPQPSQSELLMAAATMHSMGRLESGGPGRIDDMAHMDTPANHMRKRRGRRG